MDCLNLLSEHDASDRRKWILNSALGAAAVPFWEEWLEQRLNWQLSGRRPKLLVSGRRVLVNLFEAPVPCRSTSVTAGGVVGAIVAAACYDDLPEDP